MRKIILDRADRLQRMPPELAHLERLAGRLDKRSLQTIDLSAIDRNPDADFLPPAPSTTDLISPPDVKTLLSFTESVTRYYERRYAAGLDPEKEILPIAGRAAALYLLGLAFVDPGEMVLIPDPGPPLYRHAAAICGGGTQVYYLHDRYQYIPDCRRIAESLAGRTKLWILGYPHDPTGALADRDLITEVVRLARRHNILIAYDGTFSALADRDAQEAGLFANPHARRTGVEVFSLDYAFGLGCLGLAVLVGNREALAGVRFIAESAGLLPSRGLLEIGRWAMQHADRLCETRRRDFIESHLLLSEALDHLGWNVRYSAGLPFCWVTLPRRYSSLGFARRLLRRAGIKIAPGTIFGEQGEGYARICLLTDGDKMKAAAARLADVGRLWLRRGRRRAGEQ